jgi:hypothetical protein
MSEEIWEKLVEFVVTETSPPANLVLSKQTDLVEDLNLVGDDADNFMGKFADEFRVEAGDFDFNDYFPAEGFNPFATVGGLFSNKLKGKSLKPITLGMLEKAIQSGVWKANMFD